VDLVTFLITTYNSERWISESINSVLAQTHSNLQILIIDDGSIDKTINRVKDISDKRIELFCKEHSGISRSLNFALDKIKGDFVARLGSDDFCDTSRVSKQLSFLNGNKSYGIVGSNFILVNESGQQIDKIRNPERNEDIIEQLPRRCCIWDGSVLLRKDIINQLNGYDEKRVTGEDWDFFLRAIGVTKFYNIQEYLTSKRFHPASISFTKQAIRETEDILLSYNNYIIKISDDKEKIGSAYFNIGYHFYYKNDFRKANEYFRKAIIYRGLTLQNFKYYFCSKYLNFFIRIYRRYNLYKFFDWARYFDKKNRFLKNKF
jgi:glycosyltransferase involved in cell wall biosynthesis